MPINNCGLEKLNLPKDRCGRKTQRKQGKIEEVDLFFMKGLIQKN
jgi:hypothetical protein